MWTALHGKHYFGASNDLVGCGHMSGLSMRSICPLALMEMLWGERRRREHFRRGLKTDGAPHAQTNDFSRSFTAPEQNSSLIAVIEMGLSNWLVAGVVPGVERQPLKKLEPDEDTLLKLM